MKKIFLFSMIWLIANITFAQKSIRLAYQLEQGQHFEMLIKNNQTISMSMAGQTMVLQQQVEMTQTADVTEVSADKQQMAMDLTYTAIRLKQNAMGMETVWDSKKPDDNSNPIGKQIGEALGKSLNKPIHIVIDPVGKPMSLDKGSENSQKVNLSGLETGMMVVFPEHELQLNESWQTKIQPDPSSDFTIESTYVLESISGKKATISFNGTISGTKMMGEKALVSGTITGKSEVNLQTGWTLSSSVNQKLEMEMEQQGMQIPMQLSSFIELTTK